MTTKISRKITAFEIQTTKIAEPVQMGEHLPRPEILTGSTYKIKTPVTEYAIYVTINDIVLNQGTPEEVRRPFEIFINSKNMEHFQWTVALTRIISAVFRKGGDVAFLVEELHSVFDPKGGYFQKGGRFMPSLVAELGGVIELHLKRIGVLEEKIPEVRKGITCPKCGQPSVQKLDGCETCLDCGYSKCA